MERERGSKPLDSTKKTSRSSRTSERGRKTLVNLRPTSSASSRSSSLSVKKLRGQFLPPESSSACTKTWRPWIAVSRFTRKFWTRPLRISASTTTAFGCTRPGPRTRLLLRRRSTLARPARKRNKDGEETSLSPLIKNQRTTTSQHFIPPLPPSLSASTAPQ